MFVPDRFAISAAFSLPRNDGTFETECSDYLSKLASRRSMILVLFPPKCAGTFLRSAAIEATGGRLVRCIHAQGGREPQFYLPIMIRYFAGEFGDDVLVTHAHMQARPGNCRIIETFALKPMVMLRPIPDALLSWLDMFLQEEGGEQARDECVGCRVPSAFPEYDDARRADFMIDMIGPWYVSYYATWFDYARKMPQAVLFERFADFKADPAATLSRMLAHSGLPKPLETCRAAIETVWGERGQYRFNKGEAGRGRAFFTADHIARLERMMDHYPVVDGLHGELL